LIPDQSPQGPNCSRPSKPPTVPSQNPHCYWGGLTKPPLLVESRTKVKSSEAIFFFPFLVALKIARAGAFPIKPRLKTRGEKRGVSGGTSISLTKPGPFFGFGSKSVVFSLFLDINCGVEMVESGEMDEGLSFGASIGCLVVLGDFLVCLLKGQVLAGTREVLVVKVAVVRVFSVGKGSVSLLREIILWEGSTQGGDLELVWFDKLVEGEKNN
jgi:hypothetical protein